MSLKGDLDNARDKVALLERVLASYPDAERWGEDGSSTLVATVPLAKCNGVRVNQKGGTALVFFGDESLGVWSKTQPVKADDLLLTILEQDGGPEMIQRSLDELATMGKR